MARPKSEDKKQALLEAATQAIAQSGIAASTAVIARNAGVAEGTLFRYFATKDELINTLYLHLKQDLCQSMIMELDRSITDAKMMTRFIWNSYISWGLNHPARHRAIRQLAVSEKLTKETEQRADDMFPELRDLCHRSVLMVFMSDEYRAFGDGLFLALAETTMDFAARDPARAGEYIALGFEAMWRALTREEQWTVKHCTPVQNALRWNCLLPNTAGLSAHSTMCLKSAAKYSCFSLNITVAQW